MSEDSSVREGSFPGREGTKGIGAEDARFRNYWIYSTGLAIAWAIVLFLALTIWGRESMQPILLVFLGFCIGWGSNS